MNISFVIDELVEERGLEKEVLASVVCEGILAAYAKKYPELVLEVKFNKKTGDVEILVQKEVVQGADEEAGHISIRKARAFQEDVAVGDKIWTPFEEKIGRIEVLRAKQVIAGRIRKIEADIIYNAFIKREGTIVHGLIHKLERGGAVVKIDETLAFLPKSLMSPLDKCTPGFSIRALLKEVLAEPRNENQLILDRASGSFLEELFKLEIPEVFEGLVEIKKVARIAGYKSKVAVSSNDKNIDPVGTCIGVGGARIKPILKELSGEKIDVVVWSDLPEERVALALKPAEVGRVEILDNGHANVWVEEDQRSLAIGKMGQNILLATRLAEMNIHLMQSGSSASKDMMVDENQKESIFDQESE